MATSAIQPAPFRPFAVTLPLSALTTLCLYVVVVGYVVFILPVFQNLAAYWHGSLNPSAFDFATTALWISKASVLVFLGWMLYARRRPRDEQPRQLTVAIGTLNVMLGVSAVMLGVSLVRFVIILTHSVR